MKGYILDTNIISYLIDHNDVIEKNVQETLGNQKYVYISAITYYEIKRGLLAVGAKRKLKYFDFICDRGIEIIWHFSQAVADKAASIYVDLKKKGRLIQDADILIAATAMTHQLVLISNDAHFLRIDGLIQDNWLS